MSRKRISMKKIREIIRLSAEVGMSMRKISRAVKVSRPVVSQYLSDYRKSGLSLERVKRMSDSSLLALFEKRRSKKSGKYRHLVKLFPEYSKELKRVGVTRKHLWEDYIRSFPEGYSYSQFCYHFQVWKDASEVTMHLEHKAGDRMFVDYAGVKLEITDPGTGELKPAEVFVAVLGASRMMYAEATVSQKKEHWLRSNERAMWYFGGVPAAISCDNLKSGVTYASRYEPGINDLFDDFASYYRTVILPTRVVSPRDKALAENGVKLAYQRIYAPLRDKTFYSLEQINEAIEPLLERHNDAPFQRLGISRRELFEELEKEELKSLPPERYPLKHFKSLKVQINYHIELREDRHYYSVPWQLKGKQVRVIYDDRNVAIYYDNARVVQHRRDRTRGGYTTLCHHMPSAHRFYSEWNPQRFRRWASSIGENTERMIAAVISKRPHPEQAYKVCLGILNLAKSYGPGRLERACSRALEYGIYSYRRIKNILDNGLEEKAEGAAENRPLIDDHENIRGNLYYE